MASAMSPFLERPSTSCFMKAMLEASFRLCSLCVLQGKNKVGCGMVSAVLPKACGGWMTLPLQNPLSS